MSKEEILEKLKSVFVEQLGVEKSKVTEESTFISLGADS
jgi:acyl carrier protein